MPSGQFKKTMRKIMQPFKQRVPLRKVLPLYWDFYKDAKKYFSMPGAEKFDFENLYPLLFEKTEIHIIEDYSYFYQDTWGARKVFENHPKFHVDIGSTLMLVAILSQFTEVCSVDIRPIPADLKGLTCKKGDITHLPFKEGELESISSLCVLEHIGLGRYGDPIDANGTDKAIAELKRVIRSGGNLYVSVPLGLDTVYFNAHRNFKYESFIEKFKPLEMVESQVVYGRKVITPQEYIERSRPRGCVGLFHFRK
jgi:SAM-dependent methyltransferase